MVTSTQPRACPVRGHVLHMFHEKHTPTLSAPPSLHLVHLMPPETGSPEQEDPLGAQGCRYPGQNRDDARGAYDGC